MLCIFSLGEECDCVVCTIYVPIIISVAKISTIAENSVSILPFFLSKNISQFWLSLQLPVFLAFKYENMFKFWSMVSE